MDLPQTYYSLHADELRLLQFLLYHLKTKTDRKKANVKHVVFNKKPEKVSF